MSKPLSVQSNLVVIGKEGDYTDAFSKHLPCLHSCPSNSGKPVSFKNYNTVEFATEFKMCCSDSLSTPALFAMLST